MAKQKIIIDKTPVRIDKDGYICLSDLAKANGGKTSDVIRNYLKNRANLEFLHLWENDNNQSFNSVRMNGVKNEVWKNGFIISVSDYIEQTNSIGIKTKAGRYGGTYASPDIAVHFASWISPSFYFYLITEFRRLKNKEENNWLKYAKFLIDKAENNALENNQIARDIQNMIDDKLKDNE